MLKNSQNHRKTAVVYKTCPERVILAQTGFSVSLLPQVPKGASLMVNDEYGMIAKSRGVGSSLDR